MKKLSIITRTHGNRQELVARCANFVAAQTYRPIEWIVVEDGSAKCASVLRKARLPSGITLKHIPLPKVGRSAAANAGIENASGELLSFFDDDDEIFPSHAQCLISLLDRHPHAAGSYAAAYETPLGNNIPVLSREEVFFRPTAGSYALIWENLFPIQAVVFRASAVGRNRIDRNLDALEDWLFWLMVFLEKKLVWTPEITSRFFVPAEPNLSAARLKAHSDAERYFDIQRRALLRERGLQSLESLRHYHDYYMYNVSLQAQLALDPASKTVDTTAARLDTSIDQRHPLRRALGGPATQSAPPPKPNRTVAFTSITLGYLPKALVLAESLKKFQPDWDFHILLNDALPETLSDKLTNVDRVVTAAQLDIQNFHAWSFQHSIVELCCATKPFYFKQLLDDGYGKVLYFDPDMQVFNKLDFLVHELGNHDVLITPHNDKPALTDAEIFYTEQSTLAHGVFNLGFLATRNTAEARQVIEFWRYRLMRYCRDEQLRGQFTDQKWFNLVPTYFRQVHVLRHEGCNAASWNIAHRPITRKKGKLFAGSDPLLFFHFSGYDANVPRTMFEIFGQYTEALAEMIRDYDKRIASLKAQFNEASLPWPLHQFDNGVTVTQAMRRFYRGALEHRLIYTKPYFASAQPSFYTYAKKFGFERIEEQFKPHVYGE